jgi:hypothetical protein
MALNYEDDVYPRSVDIAFDDRKPAIAALNEMGIRVEDIIRSFSNAARDGKMMYR